MQYTLLEPIDFSKKDAASDANATNVQLLKDAAYTDAPRGTFFHTDWNNGEVGDTASTQYNA